VSPPSGSDRRPTLVIALDGLGPSLTQHLGLQGRLPQLERVLHKGQRYRITNTVPEDPAVLWADLATGHNATDHGILSVVKPTPDGIEPTTLDDWRIPPLWQAAAELGHSAAVINWPASSPGSDSKTETWTVSDLQLNADPAGGEAATTLPAELRLTAQDITPQMLEALAGSFAGTLREWPVQDIRRLSLAAALARAGTIQNAAIDAFDQLGKVPGLLIVRYDLVATLAELILPKPGIFSSDGQDAPNEFLASIFETGAVLIDTMIGELLRRMPPDTATLIVGLLGYTIPAPEEQAEAGSQDASVNADGIDRQQYMGDGVVRKQHRSIDVCRRPGGFAVWHDPDSPLPGGQPASSSTLQELHVPLRSRLGFAATPWPEPIGTVQTLGYTGAIQNRDDRFTLGLDAEHEDDRAAWGALLNRRALNLARSASTHRRWRFAVDAWDQVLDREDRFVYHAMRLKALLYSKAFLRFDTELGRWLERVPNQPVLRKLANARAQVSDPPPPTLTPADRLTPYIEPIDRTRPSSSEQIARNELTDGALAKLEEQCRPAIASCRQAYRRFSESWRQAKSNGFLAPIPIANPSKLNQEDRGIVRQAMSLAGPNTYGARHGSASERARISSLAQTRISDRDPVSYSESWLFALHDGLYDDPDVAAQINHYREIELAISTATVRIDGLIIKGDTYCSPDQIPKLMGRLLASLRHQLESHTSDPLIPAALSLIAFLMIHPFTDGNGRTARALFIHVLRETDYPEISHLDLPRWFERRRESYLAHVSMLPLYKASMLSDPPPQLALAVNWSIELVRDAAEYATAALNRVTGAR